MAKKKPTPAKAAPQGNLRLEYRSPAELTENPRNWRRHPDAQLDALTDVIAEVGWAGACLLNERTGRLIDGHARRTVALKQGAELVPVLVGDWSEEDEAKILATLDPLAAMATADAAALEALLGDVSTHCKAVNDMLGELAKVSSEPEEAIAADDQTGMLTENYQVLVTCKGERHQAELLERFTAEGLQCRSLIS